MVNACLAALPSRRIGHRAIECCPRPRVLRVHFAVAPALTKHAHAGQTHIKQRHRLPALQGGRSAGSNSSCSWEVGGLLRDRQAERCHV